MQSCMSCKGDDIWAGENPPLQKLQIRVEMSCNMTSAIPGIEESTCDAASFCEADSCHTLRGVGTKAGASADRFEFGVCKGVPCCMLAPFGGLCSCGCEAGSVLAKSLCRNIAAASSL